MNRANHDRQHFFEAVFRRENRSVDSAERQRDDSDGSVRESKLAGAEAESADLATSTLIKINAQLTADYERVKAERDDYYTRFEELRDEVNALQDKLAKAQADLKAAHEATEHLQKQLAALMESLPARDEA